jgi:hypothetical protein
MPPRKYKKKIPVPNDSSEASFSDEPFSNNVSKNGGKYLVIVESPSKCKKIEGFLGSNYQCIASKGHLREIEGLKSIDTKGDYTITFTNTKEKEAHIEFMRKVIAGYTFGQGSLNPTTNVIGDRRSPEAFDKHFEVALMDIESEIMQIPETEYQAEFSIGSTVFANIINQLKLFGDSLDIKCNEEKIELCSNSMEQGKMSVEIQMDDLTSFVIDEGGELQLSFSLTFMHNICLYNKISKEMEVKIGADYPMKIVYQLPGHDDAKMVFFLAPKISE